MNDTRHEALTDWNEIAAEDEQRLGVSKDVLRKLMQMNPNLRGDRTTDDLLQQVKNMKPQTAAPRPVNPSSAATAAQTPPAGNGDVLDVVLEARAQLDRETKRIEAELKRLQDERAAFQQKLLGKLIDRCLAIDPGLTSPKSQYVLQAEKAFLDKLGFSMQKLVDRQKQLKK